MRIWRFIDTNIIGLWREMRVSYLPPLMVYAAYGVSSITNIVGTFFLKEYLDLSAVFLASLAFWAGIPWALKMPLGHIVDLIWRFKSALIFLGGSIIAASLLMMVGLIADPAYMRSFMSIEAWYVLSSLLAPIGYVMQDVVADAMTTEAIPRCKEDGSTWSEQEKKSMHTTMQTLGRVAIVGGSLLVALLNMYMFSGTESLPKAEKVLVYAQIYQVALIIPIISVMGVALAFILKRRAIAQYVKQGHTETAARNMVTAPSEKTEKNWWILGGSIVFVIFTVLMGLSEFKMNQEIIFVGSLIIVMFILHRLVGALDMNARRTLVGTAFILFAFRALPSVGDGLSWWQIDILKFDEEFKSLLSVIGSVLALLGMFMFRRFMAERSMSFIIITLTIVGTVLFLPYIGMYYGLHEYTAALTGGVIDARSIAIVDTVLDSPWGQIAMIPMLAWIANSAPSNMKATYFAVMASFSNLALSAGALFTKYMNQLYVVTREVKDAAGVVTIPQDYSQLGMLLIVVTIIGLIVPIAAALILKTCRIQSV
jgi:MFS family permease